MQIVEQAYNAPGICFLCEAKPTGQLVVDTFRTFDPGVLTPLNGRKYVCEGCAATIAKLFGFVTMAEHSQVVDAHAKLHDFADRLQEELNAATDFRVLFERFAPKPKPAPRKKAADVPVEEA